MENSLEKTTHLNTSFASAKRTSDADILEKHKVILNAPNVADILNSLPDTVAVLDENRQIVFANKLLISLLGLEDQTKILGMRPGEALNCRHAFIDGCRTCGTTEFCSQCGAVDAILGANIKSDFQNECRIINDQGFAFDLLVTTKVLLVDNTEFILFFAKDIASEKRKIVLERLFYHDISNLAGVIHTMSDLLQDSNMDENAEYIDILYGTSKAIIEEVQAHRIITLAESKQLILTLEQANSLEVIKEAVSIYSNYCSSSNKNVRIDERSELVFFRTDRTVLRRVLGNMIKNALEADGEEAQITIFCKRHNDKIRFGVHNSSFILREIQLQIFQRSFSTKGKDRGLGTYSIKLLSENYLKGEVHFESDPVKGTTFYADYPV
jgi:signal transduction histidine kinase